MIWVGGGLHLINIDSIMDLTACKNWEGFPQLSFPGEMEQTEDGVLGIKKMFVHGSRSFVGMKLLGGSSCL